MARHLAICERKSAYPSKTDAQSAIVTHSMLDVLGLVRKPEEGGPSGTARRTGVKRQPISKLKVEDKNSMETKEKTDAIVEVSSKMEEGVEFVMETAKNVPTEKESITEDINKEVLPLSEENAAKDEEQSVTVEKDVKEATETAEKEVEDVSMTEETEKETVTTEKEAEPVTIEKEAESVSVEKDEETVTAEKDEESMAGEKEEESVTVEKDEESVTDEKDEESVTIEKEQESVTAEEDESMTAEIDDESSQDKEVVEEEESGKVEEVEAESSRRVDVIQADSAETTPDSQSPLSGETDVERGTEGDAKLPEPEVESKNETEEAAEQKLPQNEEDIQSVGSHIAEEAEKELAVPEEPVGAREQVSPVNEMETADVVQEKPSTLETEITSDDIQNLISDVVGEKSNSSMGFDEVQVEESASMETETDMNAFSTQTQEMAARQIEDVAMQMGQDESMEVPDTNEIMECDVTPMETD